MSSKSWGYPHLPTADADGVRRITIQQDVGEHETAMVRAVLELHPDLSVTWTTHPDDKAGA